MEYLRVERFYRQLQNKDQALAKKITSAYKGTMKVRTSSNLRAFFSFLSSCLIKPVSEELADVGCILFWGVSL